MLKITNLKIKRDELLIADNLNLRLEEGKIYTILGPNGAGKSSLLKVLFSELPFDGDIFYQTEKLDKKNLATWRQRIGYMPQDTQVDASLTALEVMLLGQVESLHYHLSDELLTQAATILQQLGLTHLAHQDIMCLSGGQRQMIMFAQVLLRNPKILMLDEPVSALDMHHQLNLLEHVCHYTKREKTITLMVLHDLSLAAQFSDEVILLGCGKLQGCGQAKNVLQADLINQLYNVNVQILCDCNGQPVIRPLRQPQ